MNVPLTAANPHWWQGQRGEWLVLAQLALMAAVFFGPRNPAGWPAWPRPIAGIASVAGVLWLLGGLALLLAGLFRLGPNLTPLPCPKPGGCLIQTGAFGLVRHPMYSGGIGIACGWALAVHGWLTLGYAAVLVVFLNFKSAREERWLLEVYPEYPAYQRRVPRLLPRIPWLTDR